MKSSLAEMRADRAWRWVPACVVLAALAPPAVPGAEPAPPAVPGAEPAPPAVPGAEPAEGTLESTALELIERRCLECHNEETRKSGLDLTRLEGARRGGKGGAALVPGKPAASLMSQRIRADEMPEGNPLPQAEQDLIRRWLEAGAPWGRTLTYAPRKRAGKDWWSLQPLGTPEPPRVEGSPEAWSRHPIDRFVYAKMAEKGLRPAEPAEALLNNRFILEQARFFSERLKKEVRPDDVDAQVRRAYALAFGRPPDAEERVRLRLHGMDECDVVGEFAHGPACVYMNSAFVREGYPSAGAWVSHALGSENDNLPAYVAIPDIRGIPPAGPANWSSGFLPAEHQATVLSAVEPIKNLERPDFVRPDSEVATREFLAFSNRRHQQRYPGNPELQARIAAYELAARMQLSAPEAAALQEESDATHEFYGTHDPNHLRAAYARNCLLAHRLLERGVRFITLYCASRASGVDGLLNWDAHKTLKDDYERHAPVLDQPTAALLRDLRNRGLLDETLVLWTTEFGRMPSHQKGTSGRDHNPDGFTCWMMGAGVKGGVSYGATDELGLRAVENVTTVYDFYATVLYLLGLDHTKTTYYHNGIERRLTDVHGHVIRAIVA
jgi:hypothetical protein